MKSLIPLIFVFAVGCATVPEVETRTMTAKSADLTRYSTYQWLEPPKGVAGPVQQQITANVDSQLAARGWRRVDTGADAFIGAQVTTEETQSVEETLQDFGGGYGLTAGMGTMTSEVREFTKGTLVLDVFDATTRRGVWRGIADAAVPDATSARGTTVAAAVDALFVKFPPTSK